MTQFLLEEALAILFSEREAMAELAGAQERELQALVEQAKAEARAALEQR